MNTYALLSEDLLTIRGFDEKDPAVFATLASVKSGRYRIVNMATPAQPAFDPATQQVIQNGWTIGSTDVEPVWQIVTLSAAQQQAISAQGEWNNTIALNIVTACQNYINLSSPTQAQTNAAVLQLVKLVKSLMKNKFGIFS
jgi:hypothetical protein